MRKTHDSVDLLRKKGHNNGVVVMVPAAAAVHRQKRSDTFVLYVTGITLTGRDFVVTCELFTKTRRRPTTRSNVENVKKRFRQLVLWARTVLSVFVFSNAPNAPMRIVRGSSEIDTKRLVAMFAATATTPTTITTTTTNKSRRQRRRRQRRVEEQEEEQEEEEEEATATTVTTVLTVVLSTCGSTADVVVVSSDPDHRPKNRPDRHRNGVSK